MFETLVATPSPSRSRLAGPASFLGHGLLLIGVLLAALWAPDELAPPEPPIEPLVIRGDLGSAELHGGGGQPVQPTRTRDTRTRSASKEAFPTRMPDSASSAPDPEVRMPGLEEPTGIPPGGSIPGVGPGGCPTCPPGPAKRGENDAIDIGELGLVSPVLVLRVEPSYPQPMIRLREEGTVAVQAIIGRDGSIEEASALTATNGLFEAEALRAVRQWRYEPGTLNGRPVRVRLLVAVSFRLR